MDNRETEQTGNCVTVEYDSDEKQKHYSETPESVRNMSAFQRLIDRFS